MKPGVRIGYSKFFDGLKKERRERIYNLSMTYEGKVNSLWEKMVAKVTGEAFGDVAKAVVFVRLLWTKEKTLRFLGNVITEIVKRYEGEVMQVLENLRVLSKTKRISSKKTVNKIGWRYIRQMSSEALTENVGRLLAAKNVLRASPMNMVEAEDAAFAEQIAKDVFGDDLWSELRTKLKIDLWGYVRYPGDE